MTMPLCDKMVKRFVPKELVFFLLLALISETLVVEALHTDKQHKRLRRQRIHPDLSADFQRSLPDFEYFGHPHQSLLGRLLERVSGESSYVGNNTQRAKAEQRNSVWVHGYARSGTSTILTMLEAGPTDNVFALFEPCHRKDALAPGFANSSCGEQILHYSACDFSIVHSLHGWDNRRSRTTVDGAVRFSSQLASDACSKADSLVFKTISHPFETFQAASEVLPFLEADNRLRVVDVVRDPRSIYASMLTTEPFQSTDLQGAHDATVMTRMCESFAAGLDIHNERFFRVAFEDLLSDPVRTLKRAYGFLKLPVGKIKRDNLIESTLAAEDCADELNYDMHYRDCHTAPKTTEPLWKTVLNISEQQIFSRHPACVRVARAYGYPL